jgi:nitrogen fixation NifU-like protein
MNIVTGYSAAALERFYNPQNLGRLPQFNGHARITGPCGDSMEFWVLIEQGRVQEASFLTDGRGPARACGSMATELAVGKTYAEAETLRGEDIITALGGMREESRHCAKLAVEALQAALADYQVRQSGTR